jgi:phage shock protein PspC (stress-responsive transcriptional regulator)
MVADMSPSKKDTPAKKTPDPTPPQRRLLRSRSDRMMFGVAGGLADYLGIDATLVRLGFVVSAFFGGFGVLAYLAMAVVVPENDGSGSPLPLRRPPIWALILLGFVALAIIPWHGFHGGWWPGFAGPLWLGILIFGGIWVVQRLRGKPMPWNQASESPAGSASKSAQPKGAEAKTEELRDGSGPRVLRLLGFVVLAMAGVAAVVGVIVVSAWLAATGNVAAVAGLVIALGVGLAAAAFTEDGRRRVAPWLLGIALVLAVPAGAVAAADIHFDGGIGERTYRPTAVADIPTDGYDLGVGQLVVDLRDLPWTKGQTIDVGTKLGIGQMIVSVPSSVCVQAHATGKAGELLIRGDQSDGVDPEVDQGEPRSDAPRLKLDSKIQLGQMIVTDESPSQAEGTHGPDYDHNRLSAESQRAVCGL